MWGGKRRKRYALEGVVGGRGGKKILMPYWCVCVCMCVCVCLYLRKGKLKNIYIKVKKDCWNS